MRNNQSHFLHFSRRERSGIIVLIFISILARVAPYFISSPAVEISNDNIDEWRELKISSDTPARYAGSYPGEKESVLPVAELFFFDPNTLDEAGWVRLGVSSKTAASIRKYISKGGRFYKPADIAKIYGLKPEKAKELEPYVRVAEEKRIAYPPYQKKEYKQQQKVIDINLADSAAFESLPGIGPTLARRIITFREKLGGFYSINQISETFGLPDSTFQKIKSYLRMAPFEVRKININTAEKETLQAHPYIRYKIASLVVAYRKQHGNFDHVDDVKKIQAITEEMYEKMKAYLEAGE